MITANTAADDPLAPWQPSADDPFDLATASHLFDRAAFGASLERRRAALADGVEATIDALLRDRPGEDVDALRRQVVALGKPEQLRAYRVWRLLVSPRPLRERLSHFWHDHFATSLAKVGDVGAMARQLQIFDDLGMGRFDDLLLAVARDPAMIRWLDNDANVQGSPNENFARELFELFTLGRGEPDRPQPYTERDIQEAARAFTGWTVKERRFYFLRNRHDGATKSVLGRDDVRTGEEVVALAAGHPASARFLAARLLGFFVHPEPTAAEITALAAVWTETGRDVGRTVERLLRSRLFFSARARRSRIRDPLDLVVGMVRNLGCTAAPAQLANRAATMGMTIAEPPSVEGWAQERAWLTSATWILRSNFAGELTGGGLHCRPAPATRLGDGSATERLQQALDALCGGSVGERSRRTLDDLLQRASTPPPSTAILHAVATLPEAQLL